MSNELEIFLKVIGIIIAVVGLVVVYAAPKIVEKKKLDEKVSLEPERIEGLDEEEIMKMKKDSAVLSLKIKGVFIALPGFLTILIMFRI